MIFDKQNLFSEDQALTTTANSTNIIDLGADDSAVQAMNEKGLLELFAQITATLATGTSVKLSLYSDDDVAFGSAKLVSETAVIATAALVAGYQFMTGKLPRIDERYLRLTYTIVGTFDAGTIMAGLILDRQTNNS